MPQLAPAGASTILDAVLAPVQWLLELGGPVVLILLLLSIFALSIFLIKLWQFSRLGLGRHRLVQQALQHWCEGESEAARALLADARQPVAKVVYLAMQGLSRETLPQSLLREELLRVAGNQLEMLRSYLRPLEIIANLSPLLGLLGTVLGMIQAFQQLESAGTQVDPAILSGGIWQALLTTAVGLSVAVPTLIAHSWLERRVERCAYQMEDAITRVFTRELRA